MIKGVAFDFDGVLVESGTLKADAMAKLFEPFGKEVQKKAVDHHIQYGGISRFEKIPYYYKNYLNQTLSEKETQTICEQFSKLVVEGVIKCPQVVGVDSFLRENKLPLFIISGTPDQELKHIVEERGMASHFQEVYGSPTKKPVWLRSILKKFDWEAENLLFIGDALSDYEAAMEVKVPFIGRISDPLVTFENLAEIAFVLDDLNPLPKCIEELNQL